MDWYLGLNSSNINALSVSLQSQSAWSEERKRKTCKFYHNYSYGISLQVGKDT